MTKTSGFKPSPHGVTKQEQLKNFAEFIANNLTTYYNQWKMPLQITQLIGRQRTIRCPLASHAEVHKYLIEHNYVQEVKDLQNKPFYIPANIVLAPGQIAEMFWERAKLVSMYKTSGG